MKLFFYATALLSQINPLSAAEPLPQNLAGSKRPREESSPVLPETLALASHEPLDSELEIQDYFKRKKQELAPSLQGKYQSLTSVFFVAKDQWGKIHELILKHLSLEYTFQESETMFSKIAPEWRLPALEYIVGKAVEKGYQGTKHSDSYDDFTGFFLTTIPEIPEAKWDDVFNLYEECISIPKPGYLPNRYDEGYSKLNPNERLPAIRFVHNKDRTKGAFFVRIIKDVPESEWDGVWKIIDTRLKDDFFEFHGPAKEIADAFAKLSAGYRIEMLSTLFVHEPFENNFVVEAFVNMLAGLDWVAQIKLNRIGRFLFKNLELDNANETFKTIARVKPENRLSFANFVVGKMKDLPQGLRLCAMKMLVDLPIDQYKELFALSCALGDDLDKGDSHSIFHSISVLNPDERLPIVRFLVNKVEGIPIHERCEYILVFSDLPRSQWDAIAELQRHDHDGTFIKLINDLKRRPASVLDLLRGIIADLPEA